MNNDERRLYGDLAWTWPIISAPERYATEAGDLRRAIEGYAQIPVRTLLDLGCGGGHNDVHLKQWFQVTGVDLSEVMLDLARQLNPEASYLQGDMRAVRLGRRFDAVIAADSIGYMLSEQDLRAAFVTAYAHLEPGGVFCTYAERTPGSWEQNETHCSVRACGDTEIVFVENTYDPDPADTTYENTFVYLIRRAGQLEIHTDRHLGGIFPLDTWRRLLREVGLEVHEAVLEDSIPMFACLKPL